MLREEENLEKLNVTPLHEMVLVKQLEAETVTKGGIVLPDDAKKKPMCGKVLAVGPGKQMMEKGEAMRAPMSVEVGDEVFFGEFAATKFRVDGEEVMVVGDRDIVLKRK